MKRSRSSPTRTVKRAGFQPSRVRKSRVGVDEVAAQEAGLVGDPVALGVEADADDAEEALAVGLADVDPARLAAGEQATASAGIVGDAEYPGEVVAAAAGHYAERGLGPGHRAADGADQAVAADHHGNLACLDRAQRPFDAVLEPARALDPEGDPPRVELLLDLGQQLQRAPVRRVRVDQQSQRHARDLHPLAA